jgi:hypothetical protein
MALTDPFLVVALVVFFFVAAFPTPPGLGVPAPFAGGTAPFRYLLTYVLKIFGALVRLHE